MAVLIETKETLDENGNLKSVILKFDLKRKDPYFLVSKKYSVLLTLNRIPFLGPLLIKMYSRVYYWCLLGVLWIHGKYPSRT